MKVLIIRLCVWMQVIEAISAAVRATPGAVLLDVDPGASTNR